MLEVSLVISCLQCTVLLEGVPLFRTITFLWVSCRVRLAVFVIRCTSLRIQLLQRLNRPVLGTQIVLPVALKRVTFVVLPCMGSRRLSIRVMNWPIASCSRCLLSRRQFWLVWSLKCRRKLWHPLVLVTGRAARLTPNKITTLCRCIFPQSPRRVLGKVPHVLWDSTLLEPRWPMHPLYPH